MGRWSSFASGVRVRRTAIDWFLGACALGLGACETDDGTSNAAPLPSGDTDLPAPPVPPSSLPADGSEDDSGDGGGGGGLPPPGEGDSFLWVSSSPSGYVVKIDTREIAEIARYATGPTNPDPSRTSVSLRGDVAVANRHYGSVTKIAGSEDGCVDANGDGVVTTSRGAGELLEWGADECVLWFSDIRNRGGTGARGMSWEAVEEDPRLWIGWLDQAGVPTVERLDGTTGEVLDTLALSDQPGLAYGPYGGAADADGGFWFVLLGRPLYHVDAQTLEIVEYDNPASASFYGMTLDPQGNPWMAGLDGSVWRWAEGQFAEYPFDAEAYLRGIATNPQGDVFAAVNEPCGVLRIRQGESASDFVQIAGCAEPVGVSVDIDGYVWVIDYAASAAFKVDPTTDELLGQVEVVLPYTYSDMTGVGLRNQVVTVG